MNTTLHRFRKWAVTAIAATTLLSTGVILASGGTAGAATDVGAITGVTQPTIIGGLTPVLDQAAGNLVISIAPGTVLHNGDQITVDVFSNSGAGDLRWDGVPTFATSTGTGTSPQICIVGSLTGPQCPTPEVLVPTPGIAINAFTFDIGSGAGGANGAAFTEGSGGTITLSNIHLDTGAGIVAGPDFNTASITAGVSGGADAFSLEPGNNVAHPFTGGGNGPGDSSTNAVIAHAAAAPTLTLNAVTTPALAIGGSNQTAGSWNATLVKNPSSGTTVISAGDQIHIVVADNAGNNCNPGTLADPDTVGFSSVPSIDITAGVGSATAVPTATATIGAVNDGPDIKCAGTNVDDDLTITFTNTTPVVLTSGGVGSGITIQITGVKYNVSGGATISADQGNVDVASIYDIAGFTTLPGGFSTTGVTGGGPSNGDIGAITVVGNTPPSDIQLNVTNSTSGSQAVNQPISPITISESSVGALPSGVNGYVCVSLLEGAEWDGTTTAPTAAATGGAVVGPVSILTTGPLAGDSTLEFQVTTGSSSAPAVITLSNLDVSVPQSLIQDIAGGLVLVTYGGSNAACSGGVTTTTATKVFSVSARIAGTDADGTAAQAFAIANPAGAGGNPAAVLSTDTDPYDALAASYLAGQLGTGILLTPTAAISSETLSALRIAGVETVYVTGGPDAISNAAISQLESTPSYFPGGVTERHDNFTNDSRLLTVQQIFGSTADGTASQIAQFVGTHPIATSVFQAAYGGAYNDTSGSSGSSASSAPDSAVNTAIIATDTGFQDAASASVMAYNESMPLILSPAAALSTDAIAALENDGIQQVIVMGGPDAISDAVVTQLEGMGISVLRVAGSDYTDTSVEAAKFELNGTNAAGQFDGLGFSTSNALGLPAILGINLQGLGFARGDFYTDALVSAQINSMLDQPELLTENPTTLGTPVSTFLATEGNPATAYGSSEPGAKGQSFNLYTIVGGQGIFGGTQAIASATETAIAAALGPDQIPFP